MSLETIGRYEIIGELGRGAMGVVYKAQDPTIGRTVALKTLRLDVHGIETAEIVRRFQNEARAAGLLNHPNIVTIYDAGEQDGNFYIAMEFMEGTTLQEMLAEKRILPADEAIHLTREICKGLDYAHAHGIVHRDVKPANIMITASGAVKIMDFGIAKTGGSVTSTGQVLGTPNYMSPEQVKGRPLDGRSDLFSFGVILYEMLTGEKPFAGQNVTTIIYKIVNETPIAPRDLDTTIHPGLSAIVTKALAKPPDERYQSGAELVRDLENYKAAGSTLHAGPVSPRGGTSSGAYEKTAVLPMRVVAGSTVRLAAAAPAKAPVPMPAPAARRPGKRSGLLAVLGVTLVLGVALGSYAYYRTRVKVRQLEAEIKADEAQQAKVQNSPAATPTPRTGDSITAPDTALDPASEKNKKPAGNEGPHIELAFASQPDGAKVEIDGASDPAWVTPFNTTHLLPGKHVVVYTKNGYVRQERTVEAVVGRSVVDTAKLVAVSKIAVTSNPSGASIWVDGEDSGETTPGQVVVDKGSHRIVVRKQGYKDAATEATVAEGQTVNFAPVLLSQGVPTEGGHSANVLNRFVGGDAIAEGKGLVHIRTVPKGATIIVNGRVAPDKTNARWPADPGVYTIVLQMDGYRTIRRNIKVEQGKILDIDEILERQ
ncbi:MAG TPA: protein kinase [Candidatus Angelobacter sp.]|nr:protein kinase [Candidatus Angelobacter sp.]